MKTFGINLFIDGVVASIACVAVHALGVAVPQQFSTVIITLLGSGLGCMVGSDLLAERKRARKK